MNISLDYDETFTEDPILWKKFVEMAHSRGHTVFCVSARNNTDENYAEINHATNGKVQIILTSHKQKKDYCNKLGINIDVWIDDCPTAIERDEEERKMSAKAAEILVRDIGEIQAICSKFKNKWS